MAFLESDFKLDFIHCRNVRLANTSQEGDKPLITCTDLTWWPQGPSKDSPTQLPTQLADQVAD